MSKHVKYISSEHYGAPQLLGDQWGYGVEMLRKCLCEGFNERIDITDIEVLDKEHVKITYVSPHRYVAYQTIAVKGTDLFELNNEYFIEDVTENNSVQAGITNLRIGQLYKIRAERVNYVWSYYINDVKLPREVRNNLYPNIRPGFFAYGSTIYINEVRVYQK